MRRSKTVVVFLACILAVVLTPWVHNAEAKKPVTITIQMFSGPEAEAMLPTVEYWNKHYAEKMGIKVVHKSLSRMGYFEKMQTQLIAGLREPEIMHPFGLLVPKIAGYLEPLDEYLNDPELMTGPNGEKYDKNDMYQAAWDTVTLPDKKIYCLPRDLSHSLLFYRKDLIPNPPQTWDEFVEMAKKFTKSINPDSPTPYGTTWLGKYEYWGFCHALDIIYPYGGDWFKPGTNEPNFDNDRTAKGFKVLYDLGKAGCFPPGVENSEYAEVMAALQNEQVPMAIEWNAAYTGLNDPKVSPKVAGNIEVCSPPGVIGDDGKERRALFVLTINLAINKNAKYKKEAFKFMAWATFGDGAQIYADNGGGATTRTVMMAPDARAPYPISAAGIEKWGRGVPVIPDIPEMVLIGSSWVQKACLAQASPEECAKGLNEELKAFIKGR